jgi:hypothetical protein
MIAFHEVESKLNHLYVALLDNKSDSNYGIDGLACELHKISTQCETLNEVSLEFCNIVGMKIDSREKIYDESDGLENVW